MVKMGRVTVTPEMAKAWGMEISKPLVFKGPKDSFNQENLRNITFAVYLAESAEKNAKRMIQKSDRHFENGNEIPDDHPDASEADRAMELYDSAFEEYQRFSDATGIFRKM